MHKEIPEQKTERDIFDEYYEKNPESVTARELNNFFFNLPGGFYRTSTEAKNLHKIFGDRLTEGYRKEGKSNEEIKEILQQDYSSIKLSQTIGDFYAAVDRAIRECGMSESDIEDLVQEAQKRAIPLEEVCEQILPIYKKLREWGYSHRELIQ